jgi:hypothetical protein
LSACRLPSSCRKRSARKLTNMYLWILRLSNPRGRFLQTSAQASNAENPLVIQDEELAEKYAKNWQDHLEHSVPYERKMKEQPCLLSPGRRPSKSPKTT